MDLSKVKAPPPNRMRDSYKRFCDNFKVSYDGYVYLKAKSQGFKGYDLATHDLLSVGGYSRSEIDRIVEQRRGEKYLIGIELEIEGVSDRERVSKILRCHLPDRHVCVPDGSIDRSSGVEIVTSPLAPTEIGRIAWYNLLRSLSRAGCRSHDSGKCGLHVSISRSYLKDRTWNAVRSLLSKDRSLFESLSRRTIGDIEDPFHYCQFQPVAGKYQALNLGKNTVGEFRFFRGTLAPASFLASIEIVRSLVEYAKERESRSEKRAPRLNIKQWIDYVRSNARFSIACEYIKEHADLHLSRPTAPPIPRSKRHIVANFVQSRTRSSGYRVDTEGRLFVSNEYGRGDELVRALCSGPTHAAENVTEYQIPIAWGRCRNLPAYILDLLARGNAPTSVTVRSCVVGEGIEKRAISFSYYSAGWGRRSQLEIVREYL